MEARNKFLDQAITLCAVSSPHVSAHLAFEQLQASEQSQNDTRRVASYCKACGSPAIAGWTQKRTTQSAKPAKPSLDTITIGKNRKPARAPLVILDECQSCWRITKTPIDQNPPPKTTNQRSELHQAKPAKVGQTIRHPVRTRKTLSSKSLLARMKVDESRKTSATQTFNFSDFFQS